jgi:hypothetical protein
MVEMVAARKRDVERERVEFKATLLEVESRIEFSAATAPTFSRPPATAASDEG